MVRIAGFATVGAKHKRAEALFLAILSCEND